LFDLVEDERTGDKSETAAIGALKRYSNIGRAEAMS
jgi:hypothetical protein